MTDNKNCIRRVTASFTNQRLGKFPGVCANSICSGLCASDMNSGDRNACGICINGLDPTSNQIIKNEKVKRIMSSWTSNQDPSLKQCKRFANKNGVLASIQNTCSNSKCTQTLTTLCDNERKKSPTQCGECVSHNAQAALNAGCTQQDITNWCSNQRSNYSCDTTGSCSACTYTLTNLCENERKQGVDQCNTCVGQHAADLKNAGCTPQDSAYWCNFPNSDPSCDNPRACSADPQGQHTDLSTCNSDCKYYPNKFSCPSGGVLCVVDPNGKYSDMLKCQTACMHSDTQEGFSMNR